MQDLPNFPTYPKINCGTVLQSSIESLLISNNQILYLGQAYQPINWLAYQVHQRINGVIGTLSKLVEEQEPQFEPTDFFLFQHMTKEETQELAKIESIRSNLIMAWKFVENQKTGMLRTVKGRINQRGEA